MVYLPSHVDEPALLAAAARRGVGIEGLSLHSYSGDCPPGLVVGHAFMAPPAIERGVQLLGEAIGAPASGGHENERTVSVPQLRVSLRG
ncbi:MAG: hypothetical protein JO262_13685 [Solirubrobacterales bacterium]|nr:hypothetical protein [Solirubrobacterales bacterium]MBV9943174.1 hypothetical protein [Solirubrobacterales bacterium]